MDTRTVARRVAIVGAVVLVLGVVALGAVFATGGLAAPTVESSTYEWGAVTDETTEIRTTVTVDNPNPIGVPGIVDLSYTAKLNDVTLARGSKSGVGFGTGRSQIELVAQMRNERIADWWVTHVNGDERSEMTVSAAVSAPGFSRTIPAKSTAIETDILSGFAGGDRTIAFGEDDALRLSNQRAEWGEANESTTPMTFRADVESLHDYPITLDGVEYEIRMNDVLLGEGQRAAGLDLAPGEAGQLDVTVAIDSPKMADWWAEHVRDDEVSTMSVEMYGYVESEGERRRLPLRIFEESLRLETDLLGESGTSVEPVANGSARQDRDLPRVTATEQSWGEITDRTSEIDTTATLETPDNDFTSFLTLDVDQRTHINDVRVASGETTVSDLQGGQDTFSFTSRMNNDKTPQWWARHLNNDERSTVVTRPAATIDVIATKFDADLGTSERTMTTDLLAGMNGQRSESVAVGGRTALEITAVESSWGTATTERAPIDVRATARNQLSTPVEVVSVEYTVSLNEVVLADETAAVGEVVPAGSTGEIDLTMQLDNSRMDEWWVSHVRNDEQTQMDVSAVATVRAAGRTQTVELDSLGQSQTIETDVLGNEG